MVPSWKLANVCHPSRHSSRVNPLTTIIHPVDEFENARHINRNTIQFIVSRLHATYKTTHAEVETLGGVEQIYCSLNSKKTEYMECVVHTESAICMRH